MPADRHARTMLPIPDRPATGLTTYDAKDPDTRVPADRAAAAAGGRAERAHHPARRRRVRRLERLRRAVPDADRRAARGRRAALQPLPHHRPVRADAPGAADRPQPPLGRHGQHHRDRDVGARATARCGPNTKAPLRDDAEAQRLLDGPVRQVPRGAGVADLAASARSTPGPRAAAASRRSTASSAARTTSGSPRCTRARRRSSPRPPPRRATTSPRTSPTARSAGSASRRR